MRTYVKTIEMIPPPAPARAWAILSDCCAAADAATDRVFFSTVACDMAFRCAGKDKTRKCQHAAMRPTRRTMPGSWSPVGEFIHLRRSWSARGNSPPPHVYEENSRISRSSMRLGDVGGHHERPSANSAHGNADE